MHLSQKTVNCADKTSDNLKARTIIFQVYEIWFIFSGLQSWQLVSLLDQVSLIILALVSLNKVLVILQLSQHRIIKLFNKLCQEKLFQTFMLCMQNNPGFIHKICFYFNIFHKFNMKKVHWLRVYVVIHILRSNQTFSKTKIKIIFGWYLVNYANTTISLFEYKPAQSCQPFIDQIIFDQKIFANIIDQQNCFRSRDSHILTVDKETFISDPRFVTTVRRVEFRSK